MIISSIMLDSVSISKAPFPSRDSNARVGPLDEAEFEQLYSLYAEPLFGYVHRMTGDPTLSEDLAQKAFVRLLGATLKTKDRAALKSYLYRIATNLVYDHWRRGPDDSQLDESVPIPSHDASTPMLRTDMQKLFERLEPNERALLWLAHVEGAPHREIAEILGLREKSVRVVLFRARQKFAAILESNGYGAVS